jgi:hypothetical protein
MVFEDAKVVNLKFSLKGRGDQNSRPQDSDQNRDRLTSSQSPMRIVDTGASQGLEDGGPTLRPEGSAVATVENEVYRGSRDIKKHYEAPVGLK